MIIQIRSEAKNRAALSEFRIVGSELRKSIEPLASLAP